MIIKQTQTFSYNEKYKKFNEKYNYLDDGQATKRVVEECIRFENKMWGQRNKNI